MKDLNGWNGLIRISCVMTEGTCVIIYPTNLSVGFYVRDVE